MKGFVYKGNWQDVKKKLKEKFPALTERDFKANNDDQLLIHLTQKLGKSKEELRKIILNI